mmetsp:Transcript_37483/g.57390  ORF Transcript_37483/g.57390 Transcript_37483/m.57390 type:complete len:217 (+) Transcript_37483:2558-3208(+)
MDFINNNIQEMSLPSEESHKQAPLDSMSSESAIQMNSQSNFNSSMKSGNQQFIHLKFNDERPSSSQPNSMLGRKVSQKKAPFPLISPKNKPQRGYFDLPGDIKGKSLPMDKGKQEILKNKLLMAAREAAAHEEVKEEPKPEDNEDEEDTSIKRISHFSTDQLEEHKGTDEPVPAPADDHDESEPTEDDVLALIEQAENVEDLTLDKTISNQDTLTR